MLTIIWLLLTTSVGFIIAYFFSPTQLVIYSLYGFILGMIIRFSNKDKSKKSRFDDIDFDID